MTTGSATMVRAVRVGPAQPTCRSEVRALTVDVTTRLIARIAVAIPLTARATPAAGRRTATMTIVPIGDGPIETWRVAQTEGAPIGVTVQQVPTRVIDLMATGRRPTATAVSVRRKVNAANGAALAARATAVGRRIGTVPVPRVRTGVALIPIAAAGPARVAVPTVVGRVRIGTGRAAPTVVGRVRIGTGRAVPTAEVQHPIGTGPAARAPTGIVLTQIVAAGPVHEARALSVGPPLIGSDLGTPPVTTADPRTSRAAAAVSTVITRVARGRIGIVTGHRETVRRTTGVAPATGITGRLGRLIATVVVPMVIEPTVPLRIAIPPTGNARAAKVRTAIGRQPLVPPTIGQPQTAAIAATAAITRIAVARRANGPEGAAGPGVPINLTAAETGRITVRRPHDRSTQHARSGPSGSDARTATDREPMVAPTARPTARIVRTRNGRTLNGRTLNGRRPSPTNPARPAQTAALHTTIGLRAHGVIGRVTTVRAGTTARGVTTVTALGTRTVISTGQRAREWTPVLART